MSVPSGTGQTYGYTTIREDLDDVVYKISPTETPVMSAIGRDTADNTYFEWSVVELAAASGANKVVEGDDIANDSATTAIRLANYVQLMDKVAQVSSTNEAVSSAGDVTKMVKQILYKTQELKRDMETRLCSDSAAAAGNSSTARETAGIGCFIRTNTSRGATATEPTLSGTTAGYPNAAPGAGTARAFTETQLKDVIQACWTQGGNPDLIVTGAFNRRVFSGFTGNAQKNVDVGTKKLIATVDVYVSDFGDLRVVANRFAVATNALILDTEMIKIAWLQTMRNEALAKNGHSTRRMVSCEWGVKVGNQKAIGVVADLTTS